MAARRMLALVLLGSCGRIAFDPFAGGFGGNGSDAAVGDGLVVNDGSHDGAAGTVTRVTGFSSVPGSPGKTDSFTITPLAVGDALVFAVGCAGSTIPTSVSMTAPGWTLTPLSALLGTTTGPWAFIYGAIAPNTSATTFSVAWTVSNCQVGVAELADEFAGADPTGANTTFDAVNGTGGNTGCSTTVTTASANEAIWGACLGASITAVDPMYSAGIQVGAREWTEYAMPGDPTSTVETVDMASTGQSLMVAAAIRPKP